MRLTNDSNLPDALYRAICNDTYSKGDSDFSITELIKPPRMRALEKKHDLEIVEDAADRLWAVLGQIAHGIIERSNKKDLAEKRFSVVIAGKKVSAQIDTLDLDNGTLSDFKMTTSYAFMLGRPAKPEWTQQLNAQAYILEKNGYSSHALQIVGLLRDWQIREAKKNVRFPQSPVAVLPVERWTSEQTEEFLVDRIYQHVEAMTRLPLCTKEDTWDGRRCADYCSPASFCTVYQQSLKGE